MNSKDFNSINLPNFMELKYRQWVFKRAYEPLDQHLRPNKVLVVYGPRRVGKTTLLQTFLKQTKLK